MKIAILGSNGFVGSHLLATLSKSNHSIIALTRKPVKFSQAHVSNRVCSLKEREKLVEYTRSSDVVIHSAFDNSYKENIKGMRNIIHACQLNRVKKLIYISTLSVYQLNQNSTVSLKTPYSKSYEPYVHEKIKLEKMLCKQKELTQVDILQPGIIYGHGSHWSQFAKEAVNYGEICLPRNGNVRCHSVSIEQVSNAVASCIACTNIELNKPPIKKQIIIDDTQAHSWYDFYKMHITNMDDKKFQIMPAKTSRNYHDGFIKNLVFEFMLNFPLYFVTKRLLRINRNRNKIHSFQPALSGPTRKIHSIDFSVKTHNICDDSQ